MDGKPAGQNSLAGFLSFTGGKAMISLIPEPKQIEEFHSTTKAINQIYCSQHAA